MRRTRFDPKASGIDCAVKRDNMIEAKDQRTTSGPTGVMTRTKTGRRHDRIHDQTQRRKITLDKRAPSRHDNAVRTVRSPQTGWLIPAARDTRRNSFGIYTKRFVELRGRRWLIEAADPARSDLDPISLSCISDDALGEHLDVLWDAEISPQSLDDNSWQSLGQGAPDIAEVLAAHIRVVGWNSATAGDRDLLQAPFRAGIRLDSYQLLPLLTPPPSRQPPHCR
jgi:hypothetical protein